MLLFHVISFRFVTQNRPFRVFHAYSAVFFIDPRPAYWETEEGGERDSCKIAGVHCPGCIACGDSPHLLARQVEVGTARIPPLPPPPAIHSPFQQSETSAVDLYDGIYFRGRKCMNWYWTVMVITFCYHQFLIGRLWAEILTAWLLAKIIEILAGADILSKPIFVTFSAWRVGTTSRYSTGESPPIKAGRPEATPHLATACGGINTFWKA